MCSTVRKKTFEYGNRYSVSKNLNNQIIDIIEYHFSNYQFGLFADNSSTLL